MSAPRQPWPQGRFLDPAQALDADCPSCGRPWSVHNSMAGFRFTCDGCGEWVTVPQPDTPTPLQIAASRELERASDHTEEAALDVATMPAAELPRDEDGLLEVDLPAGVRYRGKIEASDAMAPGALVHTSARNRQRWSNRTGLEIAGMMAAILAPSLLAYWFLSEREAATLAPVTSFVGGVLVILVGMFSPRYSFGALRAARPGFYVEALAAAVGFVLLAVGWTELLEATTDIPTDSGFEEYNAVLGTLMMICIIGVAPALFEEIAFRGLLQGRLNALFGLLPGILSTAALFALAHGLSFGTPLHVSIGVYLGYLRLRSGSLLPGMLVHFLYNASIVLIETGDLVMPWE